MGTVATRQKCWSNLGLVSHIFFCFANVSFQTPYRSLLLCSENEAASTLSSLVDMPHQTRLVELLIASPEVRKNTTFYQLTIKDTFIPTV